MPTALALEVSSYHNSVQKRTLDMNMALGVGSLSLLAGGTAAGFIFLKNGVNPLFEQERVGQFGESFPCYKVTTMDEDGNMLPGAEPLRRTGIDETFQFINVIKGDMSVVSIRPLRSRDENHMAQTLDDHLPSNSLYSSRRWLELRRQCRPGITGPSQTLGKRRDTGSIDHVLAVVRAECKYMMLATLKTDLGIIIRTPLSMLLGYNQTVVAPSEKS